MIDECGCREYHMFIRLQETNIVTVLIVKKS